MGALYECLLWVWPGSLPLPVPESGGFPVAKQQLVAAAHHVSFTAIVLHTLKGTFPRVP